MRTYSAKFYGYEAAHALARGFAAYVDTYEALPQQQQHLLSQIPQQQQQKQGQQQPPQDPLSDGRQVQALLRQQQQQRHQQQSNAPSDCRLPATDPSPVPEHKGLLRGMQTRRGPHAMTNTSNQRGDISGRVDTPKSNKPQIRRHAAGTAVSAAAAGGGSEGAPPRNSWNPLKNPISALQERSIPLQQSAPEVQPQHVHGKKTSQRATDDVRRKRSALERLGSPQEAPIEMDQARPSEDIALCFESFLKEFAREKVQEPSCPQNSPQKCSMMPWELMLREPTLQVSSSSSTGDDWGGVEMGSMLAAPAQSTSPVGAAAAAEGEGETAAGTFNCDGGELLAVGPLPALGGFPGSAAASAGPPSQLLVVSRIVLELTRSTSLLLYRLKAATAKAVVFFQHTNSRDKNPAAPTEGAEQAEAAPPAAAQAGEHTDRGTISGNKSYAEHSLTAACTSSEPTAAACLRLQAVPTTAPGQAQPEVSDGPAPELAAGASEQQTGPLQEHFALQEGQEMRIPKRLKIDEEGTAKSASAPLPPQQQLRPGIEDAVRRAFLLLANHQKLAAAVTQLQLPIPLYLQFLISATGPSSLPIVLPRQGSSNGGNSDVVIDNEAALQALLLRPFDVFRCCCITHPCACDQQHLADMLALLSSALLNGKQVLPNSAPTNSAPSQLELLSRIFPGVQPNSDQQQRQKHEEQHVEEYPQKMQRNGKEQLQQEGSAVAFCSSSTLPTSSSPATTTCSPATSPEVFFSKKPSAKPAPAGPPAATTAGESPEALQLPPNQGASTTSPPADDAAARQGFSENLADLLGAALMCTTNVLAPESALQLQQQILQQEPQQEQPLLLLPPHLPYWRLLALVPPLQSLLHTLAQIIVYRHWEFVENYIRCVCPAPQAHILLQLHAKSRKALAPAENPPAAVPANAETTDGNGLVVQETTIAGTKCSNHTSSSNNSHSNDGSTAGSVQTNTEQTALRLPAEYPAVTATAEISHVACSPVEQPQGLEEEAAISLSPHTQQQRRPCGETSPKP
ncbi:uncharacterized protein LOC34619741 [Cyclospora cayetanensis]|nr:uncharacterized protein LOC34619741 [Cyclospora cayetanensis]